MSRAPYESFNLGSHVGDDAGSVARNREQLRESLSLPTEPIWLKQVHGTRVVRADIASAPPEADGAVTSRGGVVCAILTADCLPVFVCDRSGTEVAVWHAGWRGLAAGIVDVGVRSMASAPDELLVWLGPAIGAAVYEVGDEVRHLFAGQDERAAAAFAPGAPGKWFMDLYEIARQRLRANGVRSIYGGEYCTATQRDLFFSHRRDGVTGRMASLIWLE